MKRGTKRFLVGAAAGLAGATVGAVAGRRAIRRDRMRPDPERNQDLDERPGAEHRVRSFDGTELAVQVVGPAGAPTLVFVHGFSIDLTTWHYQWRQFSGRYRCVLYDQRGHGRSAPGADDDYSLPALAGDLRAVLDAEVPEGPAVVIGHSMGGITIMALAEEHPEEFGGRVVGVILTNAAATDLVKAIAANLGATISTWLSASSGRLVRNARRFASVRTRAFAGQANLAYLIARVTNFGPGAPPSLVEHVVGLASRTAPEVWSDLMASLVEMDLSEALSRITVPALVVVGDVDRLTPPASGIAMVERLPQGRLVAMERAGHCAMLERHDEWNDLAGRFVDEVFATATATGPAVAGEPEVAAPPGRRRRSRAASGP